MKLVCFRADGMRASAAPEASSEVRILVWFFSLGQFTMLKVVVGANTVDDGLGPVHLQSLQGCRIHHTQVDRGIRVGRGLHCRVCGNRVGGTCSVLPWRGVGRLPSSYIVAPIPSGKEQGGGDWQSSSLLTTIVQWQALGTVKRERVFLLKVVRACVRTDRCWLALMDG